MFNPVLSRKKLSLFQALARQHGLEEATPFPVDPEGRFVPAPLSFTQEGLWLLHQLYPEDPAYNEHFGLRLRGHVDERALERSVNQVVARHDVLRSSFSVVEGNPVQTAVREVFVPLVIEDLREFPEAERLQAATEMAVREARSPFDLNSGPVIRTKLLRLGDSDSVLVITIHHIAMDGWSYGILMREVAAGYQAYSTGTPLTHPDLTAQYSDFARWQWKQRDEVREGADLKYWIGQLSDAAPMTLVVQAGITDPPDSAGKQTVTIEPLLLAQIENMAQRLGVTAFMVWVAALTALLSRYSGQQDIVIGTPFSVRSHPSLEEVIGVFVNMVALRVRFGGHESFRELLTTTRTTCTEAFAHQNVPFEYVVQALNSGQDRGGSQLFKASFVLQSAPLPALAGLDVTLLDIHNGSAKFDLSVSVREVGNISQLVFQYRRAVFDDAGIASMAHHLLALLSGALQDVEQRVSDLPLLSPSERQQLLQEWNSTAQSFARSKCLHQLFEEQAQRSPDVVAVVCEGRQLTYAELNRRANQLGHYLKKRGVGPEVRVGICVERSLEMIIGLLGILKAGGAYVPLDGSYPPERLAYMLENAGAEVVVAVCETNSRLPGRSVRVLLDEEAALIAQESENVFEAGASTENLAYVIYTSGSTGHPKGVAITHHSVSNLWSALNRLIYGHRTENLKIGINAPLAFDASVKQWITLLGGHTLCIIPQEIRGNPDELLRYCENHQIESLDITPSQLSYLVPRGLLNSTALSFLLIGGEAISPAQWSELQTDTRVRSFNVYGPTETTVDAAVCDIQSTPTPRIGNPIANTQVYVLDEGMEAVAVGVWGELYIGGAGLARGYLKQAELTAERFVPNPFGGVGGERVYRSGDVVRWRGDGTLEFMGRRDGQVKVRGYRIELGEIEGALLEQSEVEQAVAGVVGVGEDKKLVGWVVVREGSEQVSGGRLREYLRGRLPEYMVPGVIVKVEAMPLTSNGKVNRKALPEPDWNAGGEGEESSRFGEMETLIAGIWGEVLGLEQVSQRANFFELGGHSLLATQVISRVRNVFGRDIGLRVLFQHPTVEGLAKEVEKALGGGPAESLPLVKWGAGMAALSFAQERLWFLDQLEPGSVSYHIPAAMRLSGELNVEALGQSFKQLVERHEALRTRFAVSGGEPVQIVEYAPDIKLAVEQVGTEEELQARLDEFIREPFDLAEGPLLRVRLWQLGEREHVVGLSAHHIVADGWSTGILTRELSEMYAARCTGREAGLKELPIQYADYAVWQRKWLQGEALERELAYWRHQLSGYSGVVELPTDRPRRAEQGQRGGVVVRRMEGEAVEKLKRFSRQEGVTLFMTMLAGLEALLCRYTGQSDLAVGTAVANRNRVETEGLIGFFVNTLVLRAEVEREGSFRGLLRQARENSLVAYMHQNVPFEKLVEELRPERELGRSPLVQVMLVVQNAPAGVLQLPGLEWRRQAVDTGSAKFELSVEISESAEGLSTSWQYNAELFDRASISRLAEHFERLLNGGVEEAERSVGELPLLSESERRQLLEEWSGAQAEYRQSCVQELFEEQVDRTPKWVAMEYEGQQLNYAELNRRANQLGHYLKKKGVGPEVRVGICLERSLEMIIGLLGILKAGGAYVPLDVSYPPERLRYMVKDAKIEVVIGRGRWAQEWRQEDVGYVDIQTEQGGIGEESQENLPSESTGQSLGYVLYTSGSTGVPKGVAVEQRSIVRLVRDTNFFDVKGQEVFLQFAPVSFDASTFEIWGCLLNGGRLVIHGAETPSLEELGDRIERSRVTTLWLTAGLFHQMVEGPVEKLRGIRQLLAGGDVLNPTQIKRAVAALPETRIINGYGPTENTTFTCFYEVDSQRASEIEEKVPIGRPIRNTQVYVLDEGMEAVAVGVWGELYIGGAGLARGYLKQAELTAERFVPNPFGGVGGERVYRSGDVVRWRGDGTLEFMGRRDGQVKVRGYRIELGEIEGALLEQSEVEQAVAGVVGVGEDKKLVGWVVVREGSEQVSGGRLREYLRGRLPEYMVPGVIVKVEAMPLTSNGKVNRKALPEPEYEENHRAMRPRSAEEEILCGIFAGVLKREDVGVEENFFAAGGHSLLATQVVSRVQSALHAELPLRALFESPTVAGLADRVCRLRETGQVLAPPMVRVAREVDLPLSYAQQRLWFLHQLEPEGAAYNMPFGVRLTGKLNREALAKGLNEIVRRHEILHTSFAVKAGRPVQMITAELELKIEEIDLRGADDAECELEARRMAQAEAGKPFDLDRGPLLRVKLLRIAEQEHVLLVTMHHIVSDGWSIGIMMREFSELYAAYAQGQELVLPELPVQYADYAVWQREWLSGEFLEGQLEYWRRQLAELEPLNLPTDTTRPLVMSQRGARVPFSLPADLTAKLKELSQRGGVTLFMSLMAVFQVVLSKYAGQTDVAVGTPVANRNRVEVEDLIGFFVNTLVLRTDLSGNPSLAEVLKRVRQVTLNAYQHQDVPFEKLVEELHPERDQSRSPLFQVMLALQNTEQQELQMPGLRLGGFAMESSVAKFELLLNVRESAGGLIGEISYARDLYERKTVERLAGHLLWMTEQMVADPGRKMGELSMLAGAEREQVLVDWNRTETRYSERCLHELFEEQVAKTPEATAVEYEGQRLTYKELNCRANQLGHYLRELGAGPEVRVGICMEYSLEMVVGLLGILKSGGAYVPLDPTYPMERLSFMVEDADIGVLLTKGNSAEWMPKGARYRTVVMDRDWPVITGYPGEAPRMKVSPESLAYMIYTSGSSGQPKGVQCTHRGVVNLLYDFERLQPLKAGSGCSVWTSSSFDVSVYELFSSLLFGGRLEPVPEYLRADGSEMSDWLSVREIQSAYVPPFMVDTLCAWAEQYRGRLKLKRLLVGVEPIESGLLVRLAKLIPGLTIINGYGPTEATICATLYKVRGESRGVERTPIGSPVANGRVYVLDEQGQPVPVSVPGELYIGGAGVARGYWGRPGLTAEKFVPDPFSAVPGERLYRTGDMVRWREDGNLHFIGRVDHQVKLRGYRIEPGEIEAALLGHAGVGQVVVTTRGGEGAAKRLVAYVVSKDQRTPVNANELREHLKGKLPEYMAPSAYVLMDELTLTPNGKVDRRALPEPEYQDGEEQQISPRNIEEEILSGIFAAVLNLERVGVRGNFFGLGGHSLLATQVMSRVRSVFGVELPLRDLFVSPTAEGLAERVIRARGAGRVVAPPLVHVPRAGDVQLSFAQQRMWFLQQLEPESAVYNTPFGVRLRGPLESEALEKSLNEIVRRHEALRTSFTVRDGSPVQSVAAELELRVEEVDLRRLSAEERELEAQRLARAEAAKPFDLSCGPLLRVKLVRLEEREHVLLANMHHIISDGWSSAIMVREFSQLYQAYVQGKESPLPELNVQYADYAVWQREWLQGEVLEKQLTYWRQQLAGLEPLDLPADHARPVVMRQWGASTAFSVGKVLSAKLNELSRQKGVTLFMSLLAAFQVLLSKYAGQQDVAVGTDIANRNRIETEPLIGFFVNQLVLRTDLSGNPSFSEVLNRVRRVTLDAYQYQDVPFEKLVEELTPERDLNRSPLFQVKLVLQNAQVQELHLSGLQLSNFAVEADLTKFDFQLTLSESAQGLAGAVSYARDLYEAATVERLLGHLLLLLEQIALDPEQTIGDLVLLAAAEREQVLVEWNRTETAYQQQYAHELFEQQAARMPQAVAVEYEGQQRSYAELNRQANQLGHYLRKLGVGPEVRVGIYVERSIEMLVGLLGILKSGGTYVPLDPGYPSERLSYMLEDAQIPVLLTQGRMRDSLPVSWIQLVCLDEDWKQIEQESVLNSPSVVTGENLAYVIYTSGSTGKPKGVGVTHAGFANYLNWALEAYKCEQGTRSVVHSSLSFDLTVTSLYVALLAGGSVEMLPQAAGVEELAQCLERGGYGLLKLTPSHMQALSRLLGNRGSGFHGARALVIGGEALKYSDLELWRTHGVGVRLINEYGPTETVVGCAIYEVGDESGNAEVPIGAPISNTQVYVLDEAMYPLPVGVAGELYIGGAGLARGYVNQPALTAEKFIPNPFSEGAGERLYRTGDRVRWQADGNLEFLGRLDQQVKVRGYRIELGEIEGALLDHQGLEQAVAGVLGGEGEDKRLVVWVVARAGSEEVSGEKLREYLRGRLPDYMVPGVIVKLKELPLTTNGKVDRKALPHPVAEHEAVEEHLAPQTPVEQVVAEIWCAVLNVERVGLQDNFFKLGGHSLLATQVVARLRSSLGVELPLRTLFEFATVAGLAGEVERLRRGTVAAMPAMEPVARTGALPLSYAQQRLWFLDQLGPGSTAYNIPFGVCLRGELDGKAVEKSIADLVKRHEVLRTSFPSLDGRPVQRIAARAEFGWEEIDLREWKRGREDCWREGWRGRRQKGHWICSRGRCCG